VKLLLRRPACGAVLFHGQDLPKFNADPTLVLIPVSVTDHSNRFVLGLHKQDSQILEDGAAQKAVNLSGEDIPLSIGLLFDRRGSMNVTLQTSRQDAEQVLKTINPLETPFWRIRDLVDLTWKQMNGRLSSRSALI
jgi:hypothetical protein